MNQTKKKVGRPKTTAKASDAIKTEVPVYVRKWGNQFSKKYTDFEIEKLADEMHEWFTSKGTNSEGKEFERLWLKDFAASKMMGVQRISEFAKQNEYFNYIYDICKNIQESLLFRLGLKVKSSMPIFALKNVAGWKDTTEILGEGLMPEIKINVISNTSAT